MSERQQVLCQYSYRSFRPPFGIVSDDTHYQVYAMPSLSLDEIKQAHYVLDLVGLLVYNRALTCANESVYVYGTPLFKKVTASFVYHRDTGIYLIIGGESLPEVQGLLRFLSLPLPIKK